MLELLKKHKERVALVGVGLAFLIFIGGGIYLQKSHKQVKEVLIVSPPVPVERTEEQKAKESEPGQANIADTAYFLKPSPQELLEQLAAMENLNVDVIDEKFTQLSVLWPAYFFTLRETSEGPQSILLDVSEDGFGVVIESEVDLGVYPQLHDLTRGEKIWIGGKILAVDPAGTGTIYVKTEQLRIGDEAPFLPNSPPTEQ